MTAMAMRRREVGLYFVACLWLLTSVNGLLTPKGVNYEGNFKILSFPLASN
jgi:hypothetical protein